MMINAEDRRIEIGKRIEIDQAGADERIAKIDTPGDLSGKFMPDKDDFAVFENNLTVFQKAVRSILVPDNPAGCEQRPPLWPFAELQRIENVAHHGASTMALPSLAVTRPPLTTSGRGEISTTACASVSPVSSVKSAAQPISMP